MRSTFTSTAGASRNSKLLGIDRSTVATDIAMEGQRRARELRHRREAQIAMSVARYESVILQAHNNIAELTSQIEEEYAKPDSLDRPRLRTINAAARTIMGMSG